MSVGRNFGVLCLLVALSGAAVVGCSSDSKAEAAAKFAQVCKIWETGLDKPAKDTDNFDGFQQPLEQAISADPDNATYKKFAQASTEYLLQTLMIRDELPGADAAAWVAAIADVTTICNIKFAE